jgi:glycosyltransferase involved in cell wall biosynthesis
MPKVSVVIPTCNRPDLIKKAVQTVLVQTYQDFEIIIVDDGMKERAKKSIDEIHDPRIVYLQNEKSLGGGGARNVGIRAAKGEYVAFLDDDDEWLPEKLEVQVRAFETCGPEVSIVFCGVSAYDKNNNHLYTKLPNEQGVVRPHDRLLRKCYIWTSSIMMRTVFRKKEGLFDETLKKNQEWDLELRLAKVTDFYAINEALTRLNVLDDHEHMGGKGNLGNIIDGYNLFLEKHNEEYRKQPSSLALRYFHVGTLYRDRGEMLQARRMWLSAWRLDPKNLTYFSHFLISLFGKKVYTMFYSILSTKES